MASASLCLPLWRNVSASLSFARRASVACVVGPGASPAWDGVGTEGCVGVEIEGVAGVGAGVAGAVVEGGEAGLADGVVPGDAILGAAGVAGGPTGSLTTGLPGGGGWPPAPAGAGAAPAAPPTA